MNFANDVTAEHQALLGYELDVASMCFGTMVEGARTPHVVVCGEWRGAVLADNTVTTLDCLHIL